MTDFVFIIAGLIAGVFGVLGDTFKNGKLTKVGWVVVGALLIAALLNIIQTFGDMSAAQQLQDAKDNLTQELEQERKRQSRLAEQEKDWEKRVDFLARESVCLAIADIALPFRTYIGDSGTTSWLLPIEDRLVGKLSQLTVTKSVPVNNIDFSRLVDFHPNFTLPPVTWARWIQSTHGEAYASIRQLVTTFGAYLDRKFVNHMLAVRNHPWVRNFMDIDFIISDARRFSDDENKDVLLVHDGGTEPSIMQRPDYVDYAQTMNALAEHSKCFPVLYPDAM